MRPRVTSLVIIWLLAFVGDAQAQPPGTTTEYYHLDAIGSVRAITDKGGQMVRRHDYFPFGEEYLPQGGRDAIRFAGKERDQETTFGYFGARYHGARLGRFVSVDPILEEAAALVDPQRWNRYSYAKNNPLVFVDPDGRDVQFYLPKIWVNYERNRKVRQEIQIALAGMPDSIGIPPKPVVSWLADTLLSTFLPGDPAEHGASLESSLGGLLSPLRGGSGRALGTTLSEAKQLLGSWGGSSFATVANSVRYHFATHGREVGAKNVLQYLRKASEFSRNLRGAAKKHLDDGKVRYEKNGRFVIHDENGKILSYGEISK